MAKKTAIIILHGIGEQVPMQTIKGFVETVWSTDATLVRPGKPDPDTGSTTREENASWVKPDPRTRSFELNRITTEETIGGGRLDFFEYYWAHRVTGTTWAQVRTWLLGLLWRNPRTRVPKALLPTWMLLWVLTLLIAGAAIAFGLDLLNLGPAEPGLWSKIAIAIGSLIASAVIAVMVSHVGDVVRYVQAKPENIAIRQDIRENGVRLLENLMGRQEDGSWGKSDYSRIVVVGHSLGSIAGYDILSHAFARLEKDVLGKVDKETRQPKRAALEEHIRTGLAGNGGPGWKDRYRELQQEVFDEARATGGKWIVSDFVTLGSPLTHAEFLMARDCKSLERAKAMRELPCCPPVLEHDEKTTGAHRHFTFRPPDFDALGNASDAEAPRRPHHAAVFAYTRWTNIYSPHMAVVAGDLVSGAVGGAFGQTDAGGQSLSGIEDIPVLPCAKDAGPDLTSEDTRPRLFTHLLYWNRSVAADTKSKVQPFHIRVLRVALDLGRKV